VVKAADGSGTDYVNWVYGNSTYANGSPYYSLDGGAWTLDGLGDFGFATYSEENPSTDAFETKYLVDIGAKQVRYESDSSTMTSITGSIGDLDTTDFLSAAEGYSKLFIANGTNLKVADFTNTKLTVAALTTVPTRGSTVTQAVSGAKMIVDFVNGAKTEIYGKTISGTFVTTAGNTLSGGSMEPEDKVPTAVAEASTMPHWYDWTEYGVTKAASTNMPSEATLVCRYRGRLVLSGNKQAPNQWYMSKIGDPFNFTYSSTDPLSAVAGQNADAGLVGDVVKALIPFGDDFLVFGGAVSIQILDGDPLFAGSIDELDATTGIYGNHAWCKDNEGNLYFFGHNGVYIMTGGRSRPKNISAGKLPNLISDWALNPASHRVVLSFDPKREGVIISKTTLADGTNLNYWYSIKTQGFYPEVYPEEAAIISSYNYESHVPSNREFLIGSFDGYLRYFLNTAKDDDAGASGDEAISSYVVLPIEALSEDNDRQGKINSLIFELAGGRSTVKLTHTALTAAHDDGDVLTQATTGATMTVVFTDSTKENTFGYADTGTFNTTNAVTGSGSGTGFTPTAVGTGDFKDTDSLSYSIYVGDDAETVLENIKDSAAPKWSGSITAPGRTKVRHRIKGAWVGIKLYNSSSTSSWAINRVFGNAIEAGRIK